MTPGGDTGVHVVAVGPCEECTPFEDGRPGGYRCTREGTRHRFEFDVECPGVEIGGCRGYRECTTTGCPLHYLDGTAEARDDAACDDRTTHHGAEHHLIDGLWMVGTDGCYLAGSDVFRDAVDADLDPRLGERIAFHHTYEGDGEVVLQRAGSPADV